MPQGRAFIYNDYLLTGGGGERSTIDLGLALESLGYEVTIGSAERHSLSLRRITEPFGIEREGAWELVECDSPTELLALVQQRGDDLFVNHTHGSFLPNPAPMGIYKLMFPLEATADRVRNLLTYDAISCNSEFTELHALARWDNKLPTYVVVPPISSAHLEVPPVSFEEKEKLILNVGRFNINGHHKCQLDAIRAFTILVDEGILGSDWRLELVGHLNEEKGNAEYLEQCEKAAQGYSVGIRVNAPFQELQSLYRKASFLWQFTGVSYDFGSHAERCEHLGLVALDCFAYGALPVVYHRGGMNSIIRHGWNGYSFGDTVELASLMKLAASAWGTDFHRFQFDNSRTSADEFTFSSFTHRIEELLNSVLSARNFERIIPESRAS